MQNRTARYGPGRQMVICENPFQVELLESYGWRDCPLDLDEPYPPDAAVWVPRFDDAVLEPVPVPEKDEAPARRGRKGGA